MKNYNNLYGLVCFFILSSITPHLFANDFSVDFYGKLYPEWRIDRYSTPSTSGVNVGTMGTLKNTSQTLTSDASSKNNAADWAWSNSYIGMKNNSFHDGIKFGFDYQLLIDTQGTNNTTQNLKNNLDTRDAFIYLENNFGKLFFGKMDSIYKDWGDKYPMLGISSSNLVSTSKVLSNTSWKGNGDRSFHNRRNNTLTYHTPSFNNFQIGASYSFNEGADGPGGPGTQLVALAARWHNENWYFAIAEEIHYNWLPMSKGEILPSSSSIKNDSSSTTSRDYAIRLSSAWQNNFVKIAFDIAKLKYIESNSTSATGKFLSYKNYASQISVEYKFIESLIFAYNFSIGSPGECSLSGNINCTTTNLGGYQNSIGIINYLTPNIGIFLLGAEIKNRPGSKYASAPQGSTMYSYATGIKLQF